MSNFLSGRRQRVVYHGASSTWSDVLSGIPQGSVLGPTFFNIFINDITVNLVSKPLLYADDLTLIMPVARPSVDYPRLQEDLNAVVRWSRMNRLPLNEAKCTSMLVHHHQQQPSRQALNLAGTPLRRVVATRLLGVTLDSKLRFTNHISSVLSKARRMLGFALRVSRGMGPQTLKHLFTALVLPHLEYCSSIWDPAQVHLVAALESVQRRAAYASLRQQSPLVPPYRDIGTAQLLRAVHWTHCLLVAKSPR